MSEHDIESNPIDLFAPEQNLTEEEKKQGYPKHPIALICHIAFKVGGGLCYLFGGWLASTFKVKQELIPLIICVCFIAFDFWTTKNVTGRLLAGLRWWNDVKPDGTNEWVFESHEADTLINPYESKVFWIVLVVFVLIWGIFWISCLFAFLTRLRWLFVATLALILQGSNLTGYVRCARGTLHYPPLTTLLLTPYLHQTSQALQTSNINIFFKNPPPATH